MVVWAHILLVGWSHKVIYAFHMPLFFFISGMLFNKDKYTSFWGFLKARFFRLMIPYFIYSFVTWIVWAGFRYFRGDEVSSYLSPLIQTFIAQGSGEFMVHNSALWFIPCLFAVEIIYFLFSRTNKEWLTLSLCLLLAGIGAILANIYGDAYLYLLPWNLDAAFFALPFYGVANIIMRNTTHEKIIGFCVRNRWLVLALVLILSSVMVFLALGYGECSMGSSSYQCGFGVFFIRAFLGCFALLLFCCLISSMNISRFLGGIKWYGRNSLDVMCLHIPIKGVVLLAVSKLFQLTTDPSGSVKYSAIAFIVTMAIITPMVMSINRIFRRR